MRYVRKINNSSIVTRILNFDQKALPDPNAKYTTMDKFLKSHELKGKFIRLQTATFKFIDNISRPKNKITNKPTLYSEKKGYSTINEKEVLTKKENLVIPLLKD